MDKWLGVTPDARWTAAKSRLHHVDLGAGSSLRVPPGWVPFMFAMSHHGAMSAVLLQPWLATGPLEQYAGPATLQWMGDSVQEWESQALPKHWAGVPAQVLSFLGSVRLGTRLPMVKDIYGAPAPMLSAP